MDGTAGAEALERPSDLGGRFPYGTSLLAAPSPRAMEAAPGAFVTATGGAEPRHLTARVPLGPEEPIVLQTQDGFEVQVVEAGRVGPPRLAEGAVRHARVDGAAFWVATSAGAEEWLYLPQGAAGGAVATWEVRGGELRQHGRAVDIYDAFGAPRITVAAPEGFAEGDASVSLRMVAHGHELSLGLDEPRQGPLLLDPSWSPAGDMTTARSYATIGLLPSGKALIVGGDRSFGAVWLKSTDIFDPTTGTWAPGPLLSYQRFNHSQSRMGDGRILVVGGEASTTAEIYDEATDAWMLAPQPLYNHLTHASVELEDGSVLVVGGLVPTGVERYDFLTDTWYPGSAFPTPSLRWPATSRLQSGRVLVAGGIDQGTFSLSTSTTYDPLTDTWSPARDIGYPTDLAEMSTMPDGHVILAGSAGNSPKISQTVSEYDPTMDEWHEVDPLPGPRSGGRMVTLPNGTLLYAGGLDSDSIYELTFVYDPQSGHWSPGPPMTTEREFHAAVVLGSGTVLVAGGYRTADLQSSELLAPSTNAAGGPCTMDAGCTSGFCRGGACCSGACATACTTCAGSDGACVPLSSPACEDKDPCGGGECASAAPTSQAEGGCSVGQTGTLDSTLALVVLGLLARRPRRRTV